MNNVEIDVEDLLLFRNYLMFVNLLKEIDIVVILYLCILNFIDIDFLSLEEDCYVRFVIKLL